MGKNMSNYPTIDMAATGNRIRLLRKQHHMKIDDIVSFMGFESQQAVYKWQRGESLPSVDNLYALSRLFGTTIDDILVGCDEEGANDPSFDMFSTIICAITKICGSTRGLMQ